jgi:hypothetical protein
MDNAVQMGQGLGLLKIRVPRGPHLSQRMFQPT